MNQGDDRGPREAAESRASAGPAPSWASASAANDPGAAARGFWDQVIHALGFVPEMPHAEASGLPLRID